MNEFEKINELTDLITRLKQDLAEREKHYQSLLRQKDERIENLYQKIENQFKIIEQLQP